MTAKTIRTGMKFVLAATTALVVAATAAQAQTPAEQLKGKTVRLVVGYAPGGGFDTYARMLAPHLAERLGATVIVENRPGGGGQTATNQMYREDADGLTQYLVNGVPAVLGQIVRKPGVSYDLKEFTWLARVNAEAWALMVNNDTPFHDLQDLIEAGRPITFAALSRADGPSDGAATMCEALQIQCKIVLGFEGTSEASLAVVRGEAEAIIMTDTSVADAVSGGQARAVAVLGNRRSERFPDLKTVAEQVNLSEDGKFWNSYRGAIADVGRSIIAPPDMDPAMADYLAQAWQDVLTDPKVIAEGHATQRDINYSNAEESRARIEQIFGADASKRDADVKEVLLNKYF